MDDFTQENHTTHSVWLKAIAMLFEDIDAEGGRLTEEGFLLIVEVFDRVMRAVGPVKQLAVEDVAIEQHGAGRAVSAGFYLAYQAVFYCQIGLGDPWNQDQMRDILGPHYTPPRIVDRAWLPPPPPGLSVVPIPSASTPGASNERRIGNQALREIVEVPGSDQVPSGGIFDEL